MPDPPNVNLLIRYVFENPYPVGLVLVAVAAVGAWTVVRAGRRTALAVVGGLAALGGAVLVTGALVTTPGERARAVTESLVRAAESPDVRAAMALFADDCTLSFGSPTNPRYALDEIRRWIDRLDDAYRIESNRVTMLDAYTESSDRATVHLACWTTLSRGFGPVPNQWVLVVEPQEDGQWKVTHLTWVSINGRPPVPDMGR